MGRELEKETGSTTKVIDHHTRNQMRTLQTPDGHTPDQMRIRHKPDENTPERKTFD